MKKYRQLYAGYQRHTDFVILLILFVTFRVLALAAFRPGGLVLDFSDFYWYRSLAELTRQGYYPYDNLWTTYPPLFPVVMIAIYQVSVLLPPWEYANLWFTLLLGGFFLLFEIGNFILLYLFALKLYASDKENLDRTSDLPGFSQSRALDNLAGPGPHSALRPCWIYATLFVPVYTLTGWFESYPLFFFLFSLYLLLKNRPYLSAFFTGVGFMIKLIPLILIPVAVQLLSRVKYQLTIKADKPLRVTRYEPDKNQEISAMKPASFDTAAPTQDAAAAPTQDAAAAMQPGFIGAHSSLMPSMTISGSALRPPHFIVPFDLARIALYGAIFLTTVILIAAPFYQMNPALIFGPQQITDARQPWETIWALIEGNYDYGIIPLDMRDMSWAAAEADPGRIPWGWVTSLFGVSYLFFYTRPLNWNSPRNILAFVGFTQCLFMLWSKGYSPQWLGWPLFFLALLLPNLRGVSYATILSLANIVEANFYFIIFPTEHWLLITTVLIRTFLLIILAIEFLGLIWPHLVTARVERVRAWGLAVVVVILIIGSVPAGLRLGRRYFELRQQQSPYAATISRLQGEEVRGALLLNSHQVYDWFYPYLGRDKYQLYMLDDYAPPGDSVEVQTMALLEEIAASTDVLWIYDADASRITPAEEALTAWLDDLPPAHIQDIDGGRLYLFILSSGHAR
jgi:hypothetical protein